MILDLLKALLYGILEGVTEWLPVSSTGHLILLSELLTFETVTALPSETAEAYLSLFEVVIQLGAILAVLCRFFRSLNPLSHQRGVERSSVLRLWRNLLFASLPAALMGLLLDRVLTALTGKGIDGHLFRPQVVAATLILYGILFLLPEPKAGRHETDDPSDLTLPQALGIGLFQTLALIPGTSRSGSTILGARTLGVSRKGATEFSFLLGVPAIGGASALKLLDFFDFLKRTDATIPLGAWGLLLLASVTAFAVSLGVIGFLTDFVKKHSFAPFGIYRILLGALIVLLCFLF